MAEQLALVAVAEAEGADWLILPPPVTGSYGAGEYVDFFARVDQACTLPFAIQKAPQCLGRSLSDDDIIALRARCPGFTHIKSETSALDLDALVRRVGADILVLNGRGGLEMTDCLRGGCRASSLPPMCCPGVLRCWTAWQAGDPAKAEAE